MRKKGVEVGVLLFCEVLAVVQNDQDEFFEEEEEGLRWGHNIRDREKQKGEIWEELQLLSLVRVNNEVEEGEKVLGRDEKENE